MSTNQVTVLRFLGDTYLHHQRLLDFGCAHVYHSGLGQKMFICPVVRTDEATKLSAELGLPIVAMMLDEGFVVSAFARAEALRKYTPVKDRLGQRLGEDKAFISFYEKFPDGRITSVIEREIFDEEACRVKYIRMRGELFANKEDMKEGLPLSVAMAAEHFSTDAGSPNYNKIIENCQTSLYGRLLAAAGFGNSVAMASSDEMVTSDVGSSEYVETKAILLNPDMKIPAPDVVKKNEVDALFPSDDQASDVEKVAKTVAASARQKKNATPEPENVFKKELELVAGKLALEGVNRGVDLPVEVNDLVALICDYLQHVEQKPLSQFKKSDIEALDKFFPEFVTKFFEWVQK